MAFLYEHLTIRENQLGISYDGEHLGLNLRFLDWIKFSLGKAWADRQTLILVFDRDGTLTTERYLDWKQDLGIGFSVQFVVQAGSVVDTSAARAKTDVNDWGQFMLQRLPQALNVGQSMDDGRFGFEQKGTPTAVGQRSLEMRRPKTPGISLPGQD
ncbi:MAG: hypothetical protein ACYS0E_08435 [Planctomycetota bacterium]|jgi:hypothetical protein